MAGYAMENTKLNKIGAGHAAVVESIIQTHELEVSWLVQWGCTCATCISKKQRSPRSKSPLQMRAQAALCVRGACVRGEC